MQERLAETALKYFKKEWDSLHELEQRAVTRLVHRTPPAVPPGAGDDRTYGQRLADQVAAFGGSWTFIILFGAILGVWIGTNSVLLVAMHRTAFDPFPYIFLNLILSMLAALQAPVIMMSQNRQSVIDRQRAENDYEINLKAELEIVQLHEKLDEIREARWRELLALQERQLALLEGLAKGR